VGISWQYAAGRRTRFDLRLLNAVVVVGFHERNAIKCRRRCRRRRRRRRSTTSDGSIRAARYGRSCDSCRVLLPAGTSWRCSIEWCQQRQQW